MIIALDYDGTYTADPTLWDGFIASALKAGHQVICATMRFESEGEEVKEALQGIEIVFTGRQAKMPFLMARGIRPSIWIDDNPAWIYQGAL